MRVDESTAAETGDSGGRSRAFWAGIVLSMAGLAYVARRRMQSSWSESAGPEGAGYATEGELQTEESGPREEPDRSPTTES